MRKWFNSSPLFDREPAAGGGSDTILVDPGAEHEVGGEPEEPGARVATKSADALRVEQLEKDLQTERARRGESEEDARYWAGRARRTPSEDGEEHQPARREAAAPAAEDIVTEKPEVLLDDLNREGLQALRKRGFITEKDFTAALANLRDEVTTEITAARTDAEFGGRIAREFPDIAADSARVAKGEKPETELFKRAGAIYRAAVSDDPSLKGSKGLLLISARQAQKEIELEGKGSRRAAAGGDDDDDPPARTPAPSRRDRIARQRPDRAASDDESRGGGEHFTDQQLSVMKNLGVKPENFTKQRESSGGTRRNGRN